MDKLKKLKKQWIFSIAFILVFLFLGFTNIGHRSLEFVETSLAEIFSPIQRSLGSGTTYIADGLISIGNVGNLSKDNREMKQKLMELEEENRNLKDIIARSPQLMNEFTMINNSDKKFLQARVIGKSEGTYFRYFSIDKGEKEGVKIGDTVVIASESGQDVAIEGLVGKVVKTSNHWAKVSTIIEEGSAVGFRTVRNSEGGIVKAENNSLSGYAFDMNGDIVQGDEVYTSGIGDVYAKDIYIGRVDRVNTDEDKMIKNIRIVPVVNFHKLYTVFVITE
ncbi:rod shape-determining protein MreC [Peptoniphilus sp. KCTC 25270]|uniref:rod shape-determining protein MreC n=1 Tax=Peptoniphilus sp. KCTC 25270 TaxID=2897414 RepID=UPI001E37687A|nr:rod shape-determining protein MreC [Peptoniphilus sp. KCTC 25270]MCD1146910.1 rod shape-determining protein MreC [Peptoniphilus sp. KCTC 25270]